MNTNNEPAFPSSITTATGVGVISTVDYRGLTMLDAFAIGALKGLICRSWQDAGGQVPDDIFERWAKASYETALAMLKEREKHL